MSAHGCRVFAARLCVVIAAFAGGAAVSVWVAFRLVGRMWP